MNLSRAVRLLLILVFLFGCLLLMCVRIEMKPISMPPPESNAVRFAIIRAGVPEAFRLKGTKYSLVDEPWISMESVSWGAVRVRQSPELQVELPINEPYRDMMKSWTATNLGNDLGVIVGGELVNVTRLDSQQSETLVLSGFASEEEAADLVAMLKQKGADQ